MFSLIFGTTLSFAGDFFHPKSTGDEAYGETYTAMADLNDGSYLLLQFLFTNAGFGDEKAACRVLYVPKSKAGSNSSINVNRSEWSYQNNQLTVKDCSLSTLQGKTQFIARTEKISATINFSATPQKLTPPNAKLTVGDEFYESDIIIPFSDVTATVNGQSKSGVAQLDHTRSNTLLPKISQRWVRYRGFNGDTPIMLQLHYSPEGTQSGWVLQGDRFTTLNAEDFKITRDTDQGISIKANTSQGPITISTQEKVYDYKPTESYGVLGSMAEPWVGNPVTTTWRAHSTLNSNSVTGLLEVAKITD